MIFFVKRFQRFRKVKLFSRIGVRGCVGCQSDYGQVFSQTKRVAVLSMYLKKNNRKKSTRLDCDQESVAEVIFRLESDNNNDKEN